jgi:hypothetical protein
MGVGLLSLRQGALARTIPLLERAAGLCQEADLLAYGPLMAWALGTVYILEELGMRPLVAHCHLSLGKL